MRPGTKCMSEKKQRGRVLAMQAALCLVPGEDLAGARRLLLLS